MNKVAFYTLFLLILSFESTANAKIEARLTYGLSSGHPDLSSSYVGSNNLPTPGPLFGWGVDAFLYLPYWPFGMGLRYENLSLKQSGNNLNLSAQLSRSSIVVNYRIVDTLLFVGPIFSYGFIHQGQLKINDSGSEVADFNTTKASTYSLGVETGAQINNFLVGLEAGYENLLLQETEDHSASSRPTSDFDFSGFYFKTFIGFNF